MLSSLSRSLGRIFVIRCLAALVVTLGAFPMGHSAVCCCCTILDVPTVGTCRMELHRYILHIELVRSASQQCGCRRVTQLTYASSQVFRVWASE